MNRFLNWNRAWEQEILDVLENPALAENVPPGYRRRLVNRLLQRTDIERAQLLRFMQKYRGWRIYAAAGKLFLLCCAVGLTAHFVWPAKVGITEGILVTNLVGFSSVLGFYATWYNYRRLPKPSAKAFFITLTVATVGAWCGASIATLMDGKPLLETMERIGQRIMIAGLAAGAVYGLLVAVLAIWRNREYEALNTELQLRAEQERLARQVSDAQMRLLRAQIEPHFLFNTLGAVQQLAQAGAPRAAELTANLIAFLRASLADMRMDTVALADEFALVEAYLKVMQARLGERLQFSLELPQALGAARVPGMLLLTLAENAIKHGIEPSLRGGSIAVKAHWADGLLTLCVADTGVGLPESPGEGIGLTNVRERLKLSYGGQAMLRLEHNRDGGVLALLHIPHATTSN